MPNVLNVWTTTDGGQEPLEVANVVADFIDAAERSLDFAHYDFHLSPEPAAVVSAAVRRRPSRTES
jgi:hypothetical protein